MSKKRILVIVTGGTITMTRQADGSIAPALSGADLIAAVPDLAAIATLEIHAFSSMPGASLQMMDLRTIADLLNTRLREDFSGAIVVQGTDSIEESAFVFDRLLTSPKPVVVTGAMRGPEAAGADGPANLLASVIVASASSAQNLGVLVVLNDEVHAARFVQKAHSALPSAFCSPNVGPLGIVSEGRLHCHFRLAMHTPLTLPANFDEADVCIIKIMLGDDARFLELLPSLNYRGLVIEAMGAGHVPLAALAHISALTKRIPIVLCSRVTAGSIFTNTYGFAGSEIDLIRRGLIPAAFYTPVKACLLLRLALANRFSDTQIRTLFQN